MAALCVSPQRMHIVLSFTITEPLAVKFFGKMGEVRQPAT
jgi:hypothetical protein